MWNAVPVHISFYGDVFGSRLVATLDHGDGHRSALVDVGGPVLHAFERPELDRQELAGGGTLRRGRIDHLGLDAPDEATFLALRQRLMAISA